jgi:(p)ppGpp synthase/HD superfamily hydrolase
MPKGSVALDYAYSVHSEIGDRANIAFINKKRASLLSILKNGDIVRIETADEPILHCSWIDTVKTSKAKDGIKLRCNQRTKEVNEMSAYNILSTIFNLSVGDIKDILKSSNSTSSIEKVPTNLDVLKEKIHKIAKYTQIKEVRPWEVFKRGYKRPYLKTVDRFRFFVNRPFDKVEFDYCCHPKAGDAIVAIYRENSIVIHHKLCKKVYEQIKDGSAMVFVEWASNKLLKYRITVALQNQKGILAKLLGRISQIGLNVIGIEMGIDRSDMAEYCRIDVESERLTKKEIKEQLNKNFKIIDIVALDDAYNK